MAQVTSPASASVLPEGGRSSHAGHLAVIRALTRHAIMTGTSMPYNLVREIVARSAGYVSRHQMLNAADRGHAASVLDPAVLVSGMAAWSVPLSRKEAVECIRAGAPATLPAPELAS